MKAFVRTVLVVAGRGLVAVAPLFMAACEEPLPPVPGYVADSGIEMTAAPVFWLDDRRVLFTRLVVIDRSKGRDSEFKGLLTVWNTDTGEVEKTGRRSPGDFRTGTTADTVFDNSGYVWKKTEIIGVNVVGPFGRGLRFVPKEDSEFEDWIFSDFSCRWVKRPAWLRGQVGQPLLPGDGYLDLGLWGPNRPEKVTVRYYPEGSDRGTPVPFTARQPRSDCAQYYPFKGAYFLVDCFGGDEDATVCEPAWWFRPRELRWEKLCLPSGMENTRIVPTKLGLVVNHRAIARGGGVKEAGVFLFTGGRKIRLVAGFARHVAASPDGCKVAFPLEPDIHRAPKPGTTWPWEPSVRTIDLCVHKDAILSLPDQRS